jgi:hypothetical protein
VHALLANDLVDAMSISTVLVPTNATLTPRGASRIETDALFHAMGAVSCSQPNDLKMISTQKTPKIDVRSIPISCCFCSLSLPDSGCNLGAVDQLERVQGKIELHDSLSCDKHRKPTSTLAFLG